MHVDKNDITGADIETGLKAVGVRPGMGLIVHSSLKSFGHVVGGPETVISALMKALTREGTLLMPTFNHDAPFRPGALGIYDPCHTRSENGIITDRFWRMSSVCRSLNPTHPFAAWGKHAQRYTENHHRTLTMGAESPLGQLYQDDGYCLLMGVTCNSNTFHHVVETLVDAPCIGKRSEAYPVSMSDGTVVLQRTWGFRGTPCPFNDAVPPVYTPRLRAISRVLTVGASTWWLYRLQEAFAIIAQPLREGWGELPPCSRCQTRPRSSTFTVE